SNLIARALKGDIQKGEAREYWTRIWETALVENQYLLPRAIEGCPEIEGRVLIWNLIHDEYGRGSVAGSRPYKLKNFLMSLGVPAEKLVLQLSNPTGEALKKKNFFETAPWLEVM